MLRTNANLLIYFFHVSSQTYKKIDHIYERAKLQEVLGERERNRQTSQLMLARSLKNGAAIHRDQKTSNFGFAIFLRASWAILSLKSSRSNLGQKWPQPSNTHYMGCIHAPSSHIAPQHNQFESIVPRPHVLIIE